MCQILGGINYMQTKIVGEDFQTLFQFIMYLIGGAVVGIGTLLTITGKHLYNSNTLIQFNNKFILKEKSHHGLVVFILCWIRRMLKITYQLLHLFLNINLHLGLLFILTCIYWCFCFLLVSIFVFQNLVMLIFL